MRAAHLTKRLGLQVARCIFQIPLHLDDAGVLEEQGERRGRRMWSSNQQRSLRRLRKFETSKCLGTDTWSAFLGLDDVSCGYIISCCC